MNGSSTSTTGSWINRMRLPHHLAIALATALAIGPIPGTSREPPVINPVTADSELIRGTFEPPIRGHVVAGINETFASIINSSDMDAVHRTSRDMMIEIGTLDISEPVRFTFNNEQLAFSVPATLRVYLSARTRTFDDEPIFPEKKNELRTDLIAIRKTPIYSNPKAAYQEIKAWEKKLKALGFKEAESRFEDETKESFLAKAHKQLPEAVGSDYPAYDMASFRDENIGLSLSIQRSPHPQRDGPKAHGYNIGISIIDLRVEDLL